MVGAGLLVGAWVVPVASAQTPVEETVTVTPTVYVTTGADGQPTPVSTVYPDPVPVTERAIPDGFPYGAVASVVVAAGLAAAAGVGVGARKRLDTPDQHDQHRVRR